MIRTGLAFVLFVAVPLWSQVDPSGAEPAATVSDDRMVTPELVSGEGYSLAFSSETERSNYLQGGITVQTAYNRNVLGIGGSPVSDTSYSVFPTVALDVARTRLRWDFSYSPGFTFYQHETSFNQADHLLSLDLQYRLSPHVTLDVQDQLARTSVLSYQAEGPAETVPTSIQAPNQSITPLTSARLSNFTNAGITDQIGPNSMIGVVGSFSRLRYLNQSQATGLFDSSGRTGSVFYTHRFSKAHLIGVTYSLQSFLAQPNGFDTHTQSILAVYSLYLSPSLSLSFSGGPQYSHVTGGGALPQQSWSPAAGVVLGWQGQRTSFATSFAHRISDGGGLQGAVISDNTNASMRRQLTKRLRASLQVSYAINNVLGTVSSSTQSGHTVSCTTSLEQALSPHLNLQVGYTRLHQTYSDISALSASPNQDRGWISFSYQFGRPIGR